MTDLTLEAADTKTLDQRNGPNVQVVRLPRVYNAMTDPPSQAPLRNKPPATSPDVEREYRHYTDPSNYDCRERVRLPNGNWSKWTDRAAGTWSRPGVWP